MRKKPCPFSPEEIEIFKKRGQKNYKKAVKKLNESSDEEQITLIVKSLNSFLWKL